MTETYSVTDAESKPLFLCPICLRKLQKVCGFNIETRYIELKEFFLSLVSVPIFRSKSFEESIEWLDQVLTFIRVNH